MTYYIKNQSIFNFPALRGHHLSTRGGGGGGGWWSVCTFHMVSQKL